MNEPTGAESSASDQRLERLLRGSQRVHFRSLDGVGIDGRVFGAGETTIVLSHMGRGGDSQADWFPTARSLAKSGYRVLTFNLRGFCPGDLVGCSKGSDDLASTWKDITGAYHYLERSGADRVVLLGASIGGMSSLFAASRPEVEPAAVVSIGGLVSASGYNFNRDILERIAAPLLFASSRGDTYGGGVDAKEFMNLSPEPKELLIVPGSAHGTDIFAEGGHSEKRLMNGLVAFIERWAPP